MSPKKDMTGFAVGLTAGALAAFAAQEHIGKHRNIVKPAQAVPASGAMGAGVCQTHTLGQPIDHHVEEAANAHAQQTCQHVYA